MFSKRPIFGKRDETKPATEPRLPAKAVASVAAPAAKPEPTPPTPLPRAEDQQASRLLVGPEVKLKGAEITDCDTLVVEGRVEATMDSRVIQIAQSGAFSGKVGIDLAEIHGRFEGELTARKQLVIYSTGRVSGKIRYGKIVIEEGGELSGDVKALSLEASPNAAPAGEPIPFTQVLGKTA
ncbi:MAG: polymer-forming cytoskeletal protein [Rhodocyclales bacterium]|nr:polymer-forming cytoskeletal protein [Rhodocyclales bacterium]